MTKTKSREIDELPQGPGSKDRRKPADSLLFHDFKPNVWHSVRAYPGVTSYGGHWVKTKKRDGEMGSFYMPCSAWDPETATRQGGDGRHHCAFCAYEASIRESNAGVPKESRTEPLSRFSTDHYLNVIVRKLESKFSDAGDLTANEQNTGFKEKDSDSETPVRPLRLTDARVRKLNDLRELNVHEVEGDSKSFRVTDLKYGCDVMIKFNPDAESPAEQFQVNKGDASRLGKKERAYLTWDFSDLTDYPSQEEIGTEFVSWATRNKVDFDPEEIGVEVPKATGKKKTSDDDDEEPPVKRGKKKPLTEDDDDDVPPPKKRKPVVDEDDDDDVPPSKKSKKPPVIDEDDDDDDPPPKKRPVVDEDDDDDAPPKKTKKRPVVDEDDDDDDDVPPPKKTKKRPVVDDDDDDDVPPPKKSKKPPVIDEDDDDDAPPKKTKKRQVVDEDDDEDPPPKKVVKKAKRAVDEDDDDGF